MTSHNIDENSLLKYISYCFQLWGINYITKDILKKSKQNNQQCVFPLTNLLFDLSILEITDFEYSVTTLGINIPKNQQSQIFLQQFILSFLSQCGCPYLEYGNNQQEHWLDFSNSRGLLLLVGWLMAKIQFFGKIKSKCINNKFTALYIDKTQRQKHKYQQNKTANGQKNMLKRGYSCLEPSLQSIQKLYKQLSQHQFRINCLSNKKTQIYSHLSKQLTTFNKKNQTNLKIQNILNLGNNLDDGIQQQEQELQIIIEQSIKGMKNQQYFWMWLQLKVVQGEFKDLFANFQECQKKQIKINKGQLIKMNADYLSIYNNQYKVICNRMEQLNQYMKSIEPYINSVKPSKNLLPVQKQVEHDMKRILEDENPDLINKLGIPCFLKLQILKHMQKYGFTKKQRKNKKQNKEITQNKNESYLKSQIRQFILKLQQIKFI